MTGVHSRPQRKRLDLSKAAKLCPDEPPEGITGEAAKAWECALRNAPEGMITILDAPALERWCRSYAIYRRLQKTVDHEGVLDAGDPSRLSATFTALMRVQSQMLAAEKELGFTPVSRARVPASTPAEEDTNPFESMT